MRQDFFEFRRTHKHVVAVPTLELVDGRAVQLTALASPATTTAASRPADENAANGPPIVRLSLNEQE